MADHDHSSKRLLSNRELVANLLRGLVREPWVSDLALRTRTRVSSVHISDELTERADHSFRAFRFPRSTA